MLKFRSTRGSIVWLVLGLHLAADSSAAQVLPFEYAVKVICGKAATAALAPGVYHTAINIHNPNADSIFFRKKFALTLPKEQPGPISPFSTNFLVSDQALEIDCNDIFSHTGTSGFLKGFAIVQSQAALDVIAVYTAVGSTGRIETMHLERAQPRQCLRC
jgi:hypothetical protein